MPPKLTDRTRRIQISPTIAIMAEARKLQAAGVDVVDLGPGEPDFPTPEVIAEAGIRAIRDGFTKYTDSSGMPELRRAIAEKYNASYGTDYKLSEVIVGSGGKQPLYNACQALFENGDEVLIPAPYWVSFPEMVRLADATPVLVETDPEDGFAPRFERIERAWTDRTRGVILCSPSNPHGGIVDPADLEKIVELAASRDATVVFDECYEEFVYDKPHVSPAPLAKRFRDTVVLSGTFSKTFAMTGWRVGYMVGPEKVIAAMGKIQSHSTTNASSLAQKAALAALSPEGRASIVPMIEEYRRRREVIVPGIGEIPGFRCRPPEGAFYVFPESKALYGKRGITDSLSLSRALLDEARVAIVPGSAFGFDDHIRLSFATSMDRIEEGLARIRRFVEKLGD